MKKWHGGMREEELEVDPCKPSDSPVSVSVKSRVEKVASSKEQGYSQGNLGSVRITSYTEIDIQ